MSYPARAEGLVNSTSLRRGKKTSVLDMTIWWQGHSPWTLENIEYLFIAITPRSTLDRSGYTWKGSIYGSNRTVWNLNYMQINDLYKIELLEKEMFDYLTVGK